MTNISQNQITSSAKNYADSLVQLGKDNVMSYEDILNDLNTVEEVINSSNEFSEAMNNPSIDIKAKNEIIDSIFFNLVNQNIINFLKILTEKKRFNEFKQILQSYSNDVDEISNIKRVTVFSAIDVSDEKKNQIIEKLQNKLQKNIIAQWITEPEIIAGLVIQIDDDVIDASLKNKLESLSKNII